MTYLLDVNVLVALGYEEHVHHARAKQWARHLHAQRGSDITFATCATTELGFVRIASGRAGFAESIAAAQVDLRELKASARFIFLPDQLGADRLPGWVRKSDQTTDGHLVELAKAYQARFATLDTGIPGAELIPEIPSSPWMVREPVAVYGAAAAW